MDFSLNETQREALGTFREFAEKRVAPIAARFRAAMRLRIQS